MKPEGCSILIVNNSKQILLFLRDDKPDIPFPNMWDIPGGNVEINETPRQCIIREMKEEIGLDLKAFSLFSVVDFPDRTEHVYWKKTDLDIDAIELNEGQRLKWFTAKEAKNTDLAFGFNEIVEDFFVRAPFG